MLTSLTDSELSSKLRLAIRRLLPDGLRRFVQGYREIRSGYRRSYLKIRLRSLFGSQTRSFRLAAHGLHSVLFVCSGNIIRSPMAEALLKKYLSKDGVNAIVVSSAGLHAPLSQGPDPRAVVAAKMYGVCLEGHRTRPVTPEQVDAADAIFVMDYGNGAELLGRYVHARRKMHMLCAFAEQEFSGPAEIRDPFSGDAADVDQCYALIERCTRNVASILKRRA
jgi:low molecular weight protein-tyrosine phosphatase